MVAISKVVLLATSATAALIPRTFQQVQTDLQTINSDTVKLYNDVSAYTGGNNIAGIASDENTLDNDIKSATTDANNTPTVTSDQATTVINYINQTLTPNIKKALDALVAKKSQFAAANFQSVVLSDLKTLKTDTDSLATALIKKTPTAQQSSAKSAQSQIDTYFNSAIKSYSS